MKDNITDIFLGLENWCRNMLFILGALIIFNGAQAEQQLSPSGVLVSTSPENISIKLNGGTTSISIVGNVTTVTVNSSPPPAPMPQSNALENKNKKHHWWTPSWDTFADLIKTGAAFGGIGAIISVGFYTLYQNRNHHLISKITMMIANIINPIKWW